MKDVEDAANAARLAADKKLIEKLKPALTAATKAGDLTEANAISDQIKAAQARMNGLTSPNKKAAVEYTVWQFRFKGGQKKDWLLADGTAINEDGGRGKWILKGDKIAMDWSGHVETSTISADGTSLTGTAANGDRLTAELLGTNLTGAEPPPTK